ncbi:electron transfer DM13 domain-containing protein [Pochonia chlamydosporia 170]|uniref:Electron transfer DM13 domain-containing protein n=1 Tax=Pochonia chlamydosporia 170 TaxID=1380566 RepID=A0A179G0G6_METCM|nr:electron transfer DM13 domain-containing protein [Pochonia chlamydosporia 170]OAQ71365.1 electron transfer DM13 domain-containing protein [Pochonia chlamydosporia 170]
MFQALSLLSLLATSALAADVGASGKLDGKDGGLGGTVKVLNESAIEITGYTLKDASAPALYWWGSTNDKLSSGFRINNERVDKPASTDSIIIPLDAGKKPADFEVVGLWCEKLSANFGQAKLSKDGSGSGSATTSGSGSQPTKMGGAAGFASPQVPTILAFLSVVLFASQLV